jgi:hypothetical protein
MEGKMSGDLDFKPRPNDESSVAGRHPRDGNEAVTSSRKWDEFEIRRREFFGLGILKN